MCAQGILAPPGAFSVAIDDSTVCQECGVAQIIVVVVDSACDVCRKER